MGKNKILTISILLILLSTSLVLASLAFMPQINEAKTEDNTAPQSKSIIYPQLESFLSRAIEKIKSNVKIEISKNSPMFWMNTYGTQTSTIGTKFVYNINLANLAKNLITAGIDIMKAIQGNLDLETAVTDAITAIKETLQLLVDYGKISGEVLEWFKICESIAKFFTYYDDVKDAVNAIKAILEHDIDALLNSGGNLLRSAFEYLKSKLYTWIARKIAERLSISVGTGPATLLAFIVLTAADLIYDVVKDIWENIEAGRPWYENLQIGDDDWAKDLADAVINYIKGYISREEFMDQIPEDPYPYSWAIGGYDSTDYPYATINSDEADTDPEGAPVSNQDLILIIGLYNFDSSGSMTVLVDVDFLGNTFYRVWVILYLYDCDAWGGYYYAILRVVNLNAEYLYLVMAYHWGYTDSHLYLYQIAKGSITYRYHYWFIDYKPVDLEVIYGNIQSIGFYADGYCSYISGDLCLVWYEYSSGTLMETAYYIYYSGSIGGNIYLYSYA